MSPPAFPGAGGGDGDCDGDGADDDRPDRGEPTPGESAPGEPAPRDPTPASHPATPPAPEGAAAAQSFYTRYARLYDALARHTPGIQGLRAGLAAALDPGPDATVLDLGCGTGATLPHLRERVGPEGRVLGLDFAPGAAAVARRRTDPGNVHVLRGDATRPPARGADAVVASFVVGMLPDPAGAVRAWADLVGPGGRLALLDLARTTRPGAAWLNGLFRLLTLASAPPGTRGRRDPPPTRVLDERVAAAHRALFEVCTDCRRSTHAGGFVRLSAGTVE